MIETFAGWAVAAGIPAKFARAAVFVVLAIVLVLVLWVAKCSYDKRIIATHEATQNAINANADRQADQNAATSRVADQSRSDAENTAIKEAVNEAGPDPAARRSAYYRCVELQQAARRSGKLAASC